MWRRGVSRDNENNRRMRYMKSRVVAVVRHAGAHDLSYYFAVSGEEVGGYSGDIMGRFHIIVLRADSAEDNINQLASAEIDDLSVKGCAIRVTACSYRIIELIIYKCRAARRSTDTRPAIIAARIMAAAFALAHGMCCSPPRMMMRRLAPGGHRRNCLSPPA